MKTNTDPRHIARIFAMQHLFEKDFSDTLEADIKPEELSNNILCEVNNVEQCDNLLLKNLISSVEKNREEIDIKIEKFAPERPLEEISQVDLQILRIAIAEGFVTKSTPPKVAIDEAIELAKEFGTPSSRRFVNGVLGNLLIEEQKKDNNND